MKQDQQDRAYRKRICRTAEFLFAGGNQASTGLPSLK